MGSEEGMVPGQVSPVSKGRWPLLGNAGGSAQPASLPSPGPGARCSSTSTHQSWVCRWVVSLCPLATTPSEGPRESSGQRDSGCPRSQPLST